MHCMCAAATCTHTCASQSPDPVPLTAILLAVLASRSRSISAILEYVILAGSSLSRTKTLGHLQQPAYSLYLADIGSSPQASCLRVAGFEARARAHVCWFDSCSCGRLVVEDARRCA